MKIGIIAVGSELLLGQINNTNGQYLSQLFNEIGHSVIEHAVIGDNPERLERVVRDMLERYDTVVLTGGLGPTKDDLTKHTVAKVLNKELVIDSQALHYIEAYFEEQHQTMTPNNRQQALVIEGSTVLENKEGMAPGMLIKDGEKRVVMLPGPPKENKPMARHELLPLLMDGEQSIFSEQLKFAGIGESRVETELIDLIDNQTNPTIAPLAGSHEVKIRLTANGENKAQCKQAIQPVKDEILSRIGQYYYGSDEIELEEAVMQQLKGTVALYDGVTDGMLYSRLKDYDDRQQVKGMLPHSESWIKSTDTIDQQLSVSARIVRELFESELGISVLYREGTVYLGILANNDLKVYDFKMTQKRNLLKTRTPNYVMIRLLNELSL
ncbi:CinA family nicotinamide mononucleotide deamidase-related protein [Staphylococcus pettenkoferi]|uniref:Putative competence-damage inducible protein n=1 Tax=Staphylococcus pettenkoferi TaxID=170573 RepID=A0A9Q4D580_9STAP|nr:CinA family nicotinamide mononucleotide deamidase-related protein [Staphylococcus pettenkoferi]MCY1568255.1 CinA family nicotinamide mononucleotide deamidase-related protein [Staphylococcus pettenkoferi]MCY1575381.1 CinA family nicotinamide mononucleotide deamidase-related protein [Staphylococcus pettenkoferi]MCY1594858.1 CinA family nicotinamide mononucleotide deamidase-related protein [Staphylococcus pettenkoferi]MCY1618211.1 CinA family nicotinamide mononucleotide deamidase-related protei